MNGRLDHPITAFYIVYNRELFKNSLRHLDSACPIYCLQMRMST